MKTYFDKPTQIKFYDIDNEDWLGGIAYKDEIICGCCGQIIYITDYLAELDEARKEGMIIPYEPIHPYEYYWADFSSYIMGD